MIDIYGSCSHMAMACVLDDGDGHGLDHNAFRVTWVLFEVAAVIPRRVLLLVDKGEHHLQSSVVSEALVKQDYRILVSSWFCIGPLV
jgi:hypothetical protein